MGFVTVLEEFLAQILLDAVACNGTATDKCHSISPREHTILPTTILL